METMKDGTPFNPARACQVPKCPNLSSARLTQEGKEDSRKDLCARHALVMKRVYPQQVVVLAAWNELTLEDFDD